MSKSVSSGARRLPSSVGDLDQRTGVGGGAFERGPFRVGRCDHRLAVEAGDERDLGGQPRRSGAGDEHAVPRLGADHRERGLIRRGTRTENSHENGLEVTL